MSFRGHIHNGVVVIDETTSLPEGTQVTIEIANLENQSKWASQNYNSHHLSAKDLIKLPVEQRNQILMSAAILAEKEYRVNPDLTSFDAFSEDDLYDETSQR